jgi:hypothetical protein
MVTTRLRAATEMFPAITEDAASLARFVKFADNTCHIPTAELQEILTVIKHARQVGRKTGLSLGVELAKAWGAGKECCW